MPVFPLLPSHSVIILKNSEVLSISLSFAVLLPKQVCRKAIFSFWEGNWDYKEQFLVGAPKERKLILGAAAGAGARGTGRVGLGIRGDLLLVSNACSLVFASNRAKNGACLTGC